MRGFSGAGGHPLVNFAGSGLTLIRAEHLEPDDDASIAARSPAARSPGTTRLSATPRPPAVEAASVLHHWTGLISRRRSDSPSQRHRGALGAGHLPCQWSREACGTGPNHASEVSNPR